jgi:hypothetical protein
MRTDTSSQAQDRVQRMNVAGEGFRPSVVLELPRNLT